MTQKIGRNEPCPCGSGKKYKQCCGKSAAAPEVTPDSPEGVVERAVVWLAGQHRKAFAAALEEQSDSTVLACFDDDQEAADEAVADVEPELWNYFQGNMTESLLATGDIIVKGERQRVSELLLGPHGPLLTVGQRAWLAQLAAKPLRLYDITDVVPGGGMTLCDALDLEQPPVAITERSASRRVSPGQQIGARVLAVAGGHQISGAIYPFSMMSGRTLLDDLRIMLAQPSPHAQDHVLRVERLIISGWLTQHLRPVPLPQMVHASTGEALLFISDQYEVLDWDTLAGALAVQPDVEGSREAGWARLLEGADGQTRALARVAPQSGGQRVSVLTKSVSLADSRRLWLEGLAGAAGLERVKGLLRAYQIGEQRMAETQGRREISYQFLWDELGLVR